jgi:hypothetical protein
MAPRLSFACELGSDELTKLFADGSVLDQLVGLKASVTLGLVDLSAERAAIVRRLNAARVPVFAWLLLPVDQGYWFNANNAPLAASRYDAFRAWTAEHSLAWEGIGIDVEPDLREIQRAVANRWSLAPTILRRLLDDRARRHAVAQYVALVARARSAGYHVDSYEFPFVEDERAVEASVIRRILGLVDVGADRVIPMLYTSLMGSRGVGFLWSYGQGKKTVAIGSTGGGMAFEGIGDRPLTWDEFVRDLRLVSRFADDIGVFSLEGCVQQGFLARLSDFAWDGPVDVPFADAATVDRWRAIARASLWLTARPYLLLALPMLSIALFRRFGKKTRAPSNAKPDRTGSAHSKLR